MANVCLPALQDKGLFIPVALAISFKYSLIFWSAIMFSNSFPSFLSPFKMEIKALSGSESGTVIGSGLEFLFLILK